ERLAKGGVAGLLLADVPEFAVTAGSCFLKLGCVYRFAVRLAKVHAHQARRGQRCAPSGKQTAAGRNEGVKDSHHVSKIANSKNVVYVWALSKLNVFTTRFFCSQLQSCGE
ncbi:MAG: hypothetical protein QGF29_01680, partial [Verrucomicrobiota bacterium]|nr:hypothetical protein [Verrucomicrobiota bacterium]